MKDCFFAGNSITAVYLAFFSMIAFFVVSDVSALPIKTIDSDGMPINVAEEVRKNPEFFLERIKTDLRLGNLGNVGFLANILLEIQPQNADVRALYAISLASQEDAAKAKQELDRAGQGQKETFYTLSAGAMNLRLQKKYDVAIKQCKKAIAMDKTHPYPWNILGRIYFDQQNYNQAQASFQKAVELEPKFAPAFSNLGASAFLLGDMSGAVGFFQKAISLNPDSFTSHFGLATVYETMGNDAQAAEEFQKSFKLKPDDSSVLQELGQSQLKAGRYSDALASGQEMEKRGLHGADEILADASLHLGHTQETFRYLDKASPTDRAYYIRGFAFMVEKQYKDALESMNTVLQKNNQHFGAYTARIALKFYLGEQVDLDGELKRQWGKSLDRLVDFMAGSILASNDNWDTATERWQSAEGLIPGFSITGLSKDTLVNGLKKEEFRFLNLGVLYYFRNLPDNALAEFKEALQVNQNSILANYWAAQIYLKKGDRENAIESYENAIKKAPAFFSALYAVGELKFLSGHPDLAVNYYEQALKVKKDAGILIKLGILYENNKQYEMAEKKYETVIESFPNFFVGYNQLSWLYARRNEKLDKALELAKKADTIQPGNASILDTIGWIHFHNKEYDTSLKYLNKSLEVMPNNPTVLYHLAAVQYAMGTTIEAKSSLEQALLISTNFEELEEAEKLLEMIQ